MHLKKPMPMIPLNGSSVTPTRPRADAADRRAFIRSLSDPQCEGLCDLDAQHQARRIAAEIAHHQPELMALGAYVAGVLASQEITASLGRGLLQDAMQRPAFARLADLYEAAHYSESARRELTRRLEHAHSDSRGYPGPKTKRLDEPRPPSSKRRRQLNAALQTYDFVDSALKKSAIFIGLAYFIARGQPETIIEVSDDFGVSWPIVPRDWTPRNDEDEALFEALRLGGMNASRSGYEGPSSAP
jgi:hypothetical protein